MKRRWAPLLATGLLAAAGVALAVVGVRVVGLEETRARSEALARARRVLDALCTEIGGAAPEALGDPVHEARVRAAPTAPPWSPTQAPSDLRVLLEEADWTEVRRADPEAAASLFARVADATADPMTRAYADLRAGILLRRLDRTEDARRRLVAARGGTDDVPYDDGAARWDVGPGLVAARHLAALDLASGRTDAALEAIGALMPSRLAGRDVVTLPRPGRLGAEDLVGALARDPDAVPQAETEAYRQFSRVGLLYARVLLSYAGAREYVRRLGERDARAIGNEVLARRADGVISIPVEAVLRGRAGLAAAGAPGDFGGTTDAAAVPRDAVATRANPPLEGLWLWIRPRAEPSARSSAAWAVAAALGVYLVGAGLAVLSIRRSARAARMQTDFVASVSHDMKTPIASVQAVAEMLADGRVSDPAKAHDYAARIQGEMARLGATVRDVLDAARIERDPTAVVRPRPTQPAEAVEAAVEAARPGLERRGVRLEVEATPAPAPLPLDPDAFAHVVHNLLDNAAKFAGRERRVEVRAAPAPGGYRVEVLDRGPGVPPAERERVFERFGRGEEARVRALPGVGLGLYVAREIVRAHGGTIRVEDREGGGARFVVEVPEGGR